MKRMYFGAVCLCCIGNLSAQTTATLQGIVTDSLGTKILEKGTVAVLTGKNSTRVVQQPIEQGRFSVQYTAQDGENYYLFVFVPGYNDRYQDITCKNGDLGKIILSPLSVALQEVVVKSDRLQHDIVNGNDVFKISGTSLAQSYSIKEMLQQLPGIAVIGNGIQVAGAGQPIYTINGLSPRAGEMDRITPDMIDKVTINTMPSAKYDSRVTSIIDLKLKKQWRDYVNARLTNSFVVGKDLCNEQPTLNINMQAGRFSQYIGYSFGFSDMLGRKSSTDITQLPDENIHRYNEDNEKLHKREHSLTYAPKWEWKDGSFIDFQYQLARNNMHCLNDIQGWNRSTPNGGTPFSEDIRSKMFNRQDTYSHDLSARYSRQLSETDNIVMSAGYTNSRTPAGGYIEETILGEINTTDQYTLQKTHTYSGNIEYNGLLWQKWQLNAGGKYAFLDIQNKNDYEGMYSSQTNITTQERTAAVYLNVSQQLKKFYYSIGIRGEYQRMKTNFLLNSKKEESENFYVIPVLAFNYRPSEQVSMNLSYRYGRTNPLASDLDPTVVYQNKYMYKVGNPNLKPVESHRVNYRLSLPYSLTFSTNLFYVHNGIQLVFENDANNPGVIKSYGVNLNRTHLNVSLSWLKRWGRYMLSSQAGYKQAFSKGTYLGKEISFSKPSFDFSIYNQYTFGKGWSASINAYYRGKDVNFPQENSDSYSTSLSVSYTGLKNLSFSLGGDNLWFKDTKFTQKYGYLYRENLSRFMRRSLYFNLTYTFNHYTNKFRRNGVNTEAVGRSLYMR